MQAVKTSMFAYFSKRLSASINRSIARAAVATGDCLLCRHFRHRMRVAPFERFGIMNSGAGDANFTRSATAWDASIVHHAALKRLAAAASDGSFFESHNARTDGSNNREPPIMSDGIWRFSAMR